MLKYNASPLPALNAEQLQSHMELRRPNHMRKNPSPPHNAATSPHKPTNNPALPIHAFATSAAPFVFAAALGLEEALGLVPLRAALVAPEEIVPTVPFDAALVVCVMMASEVAVFCWAEDRDAEEDAAAEMEAEETDEAEEDAAAEIEAEADDEARAGDETEAELEADEDAEAEAEDQTAGVLTDTDVV